MKRKADMSEKLCTCGGHNMTNIKRNKNHHSTKNRLEVKAVRRMKKLLEGQQDINPEISELIDENFHDLLLEP